VLVNTLGGRTTRYTFGFCGRNGQRSQKKGLGKKKGGGKGNGRKHKNLYAAPRYLGLWAGPLMKGDGGCGLY